MRYAHITDLHLGHRFEQRFGIDAQQNLMAVLRDVHDRGISTIICTGDIAEDHLIGRFFDIFAEEQLDVIDVPGNHDDPALLKLPAAHVHGGECYWHVAVGAHRIFFLDTHDASMSERQLDWLASGIEAHPGENIIFMHHPILDWDGSFMDRTYPLYGRDRIRDRLVETGKPIQLFCGHYHCADERRHRNIRQFITPSLLYQIKKHAGTLERDPAPIGYRIIDLGGIFQTQLIGIPSR